MKQYQSLRARFRKAALLRSTEGVLGWDQETGLPPRAVEWRAEQMSYLSGLVHQLSTAPEVGEWLAICEGTEWPEGAVEPVKVRGWRRD